MGDDPQSSVVDKWGRSHDVPNLHIFDGSTFPTSSGVNPTATIAALSLRFTEHLIEQAGGQETPRKRRALRYEPVYGYES